MNLFRVFRMEICISFVCANQVGHVNLSIVDVLESRLSIRNIRTKQVCRLLWYFAMPCDMRGALAKTAAGPPTIEKLWQAQVLVYGNLPLSGRLEKPNCLCQRELHEVLNNYLVVARLDQYQQISQFDVLWPVNDRDRELETRPWTNLSKHT
jgi:hypothetical protein